MAPAIDKAVPLDPNTIAAFTAKFIAGTMNYSFMQYRSPLKAPGKKGYYF